MTYGKLMIILAAGQVDLLDREADVVAVVGVQVRHAEDLLVVHDALPEALLPLVPERNEKNEARRSGKNKLETGNIYTKTLAYVKNKTLS